jgi:hypothetical protein
MRVELVVRPLNELRMVFGRHNQYLAFNERGDVVDIAPWFLKLDADKGVAHREVAEPIGDDQWVRIAIEVDDRERRVFVNDLLRHTWHGDFAGFRTRLAIAPTKSALTVASLRVLTLF